MACESRTSDLHKSHESGRGLQGVTVGIARMDDCPLRDFQISIVFFLAGGFS